MECMINIIDFFNTYSGFIMCLLTLGTLIATGVTAWATRQIKEFNGKQIKIANQKRKDDLFKIRWKFYQEIIEFIKNIDFYLDELIYSDQIERYKKIAQDSAEYVVREHYGNLNDDEIKKIVSSCYDSTNNNLLLFNKLEIMLALYDTIQGNIHFYVDVVYLRARFFINKSKYLFGNDVSEFLEQFLSIDTIEKTYRKHYLDIIQKFELDNNILKKTIEIYGWSVTEDPLIRGSRNKINKINNTTLEIFKEENKESWENLNKVLSLLKDKSLLFRTTAGLLENSDFKKLEEKFDKYLKLDEM